MAVEAQQLSPEEKLLKVIQTGREAEKRTSPEEQLLSAVKPRAAPAPVILPPKTDRAAAVPTAPAAVKPTPAVVVVPQRPEEKPAAVAAKASPPPVAQRAELRSQKAEVVAPPAPAVAKPVPVAPKKPAVEAKPPVPAKSAEPKKAAEAKLKVLKSEPASLEKEAPAKTLIGTPGSSDIGGSVEACGTGRPGRKFTMGAVNRGLVAAVLLILAFTVYEIWAAAKMAEIRSQGAEGGGQKSGGGPVVEAGSPVDLPELASYVEPWKDKDIFFQPDIGPGTDPKSLPPPPDWTTQLKLMGFVGQKAIVRDTKSDTIFIQGPAEKIFIGKCTLELVQIHGDYVVFSDGKNSFSIK